MNEKVLVAGSEYKAAAKLKRIFTQLVLLVACCFGAFARPQIVAAQQMEKGSIAQLDGFVGLALFIYQKRKLDPGFLPEELCVLHVSQADRGQAGAFFVEGLLKFAQLRDVLATEDSAIVAEKDQHRWAFLPEGAKTQEVAFGIGKGNVGKLTAERFRHAGHFPGQRVGCQVWAGVQHIYGRETIGISNLLVF
jgi:hypothetical protein